LTALLGITLQAGPAWADSQAAEAGIGTAAALTSLIYGPVKVCYATLGLVIGGVAWGLSGGDGEVMNAILTPAVRGDYVVTPEMLRGSDDIELFGRNPAYRPHVPPAGGDRRRGLLSSGLPFLPKGTSGAVAANQRS
jgi:hypothetical protein